MNPPPLDYNTVADLFLQRNMIREATSFLLDVLKEDREDQAAMQTRCSRSTSSPFPTLPTPSSGQGKLTHYDRPRIAQLCEKAGLYMRALGCLHRGVRPEAVLHQHALQSTPRRSSSGLAPSPGWALACIKGCSCPTPGRTSRSSSTCARSTLNRSALMPSSSSSRSTTPPRACSSTLAHLSRQAPSLITTRSTLRLPPRLARSRRSSASRANPSTTTRRRRRCSSWRPGSRTPAHSSTCAIALTWWTTSPRSCTRTRCFATSRDTCRR